MSEVEEGLDFQAEFKGMFGQNRANTQARLRAERIAGMTPKQREAHSRKPKKKQINFRATEETRQLIEALSAHLGKSATNVIELAVHTLAESVPGLKAKRGRNDRS